MQKILFFFFIVAAGIISCSPVRYFIKGQQTLLSDTALAGAHTGISIYDPAVGKYLYNYQGDKYFVPASNTKLFTCYAAMKYLGDSLVAARYLETPDGVRINSSGDPTFLHPDFAKQPFLEVLKRYNTLSFYSLPQVKKYGPGWSWDDYEADYMPERSSFPIYGNVVWFRKKAHLAFNKTGVVSDTVLKIHSGDTLHIEPSFFAKRFFGCVFSNSEIYIKRHPIENQFYSSCNFKNLIETAIPFVTKADSVNGYSAILILESLLDKPVREMEGYEAKEEKESLTTIHSQPTDSLLKPMMHRSDNFFAEQSLLMVSNEKLGYMNDEAIIDTLLKNDLKDLPQKPVWVDGSGLSRYNQFTPQDIITLLLKIKIEFGLERIRNILPKGNTGTLTNYYQNVGANIFAKTGTLSGQVALSGYLVCKSNKLLLFSIMVNNHNSSGRGVRRAVEKFVTGIWERN